MLPRPWPCSPAAGVVQFVSHGCGCCGRQGGQGCRPTSLGSKGPGCLAVLTAQKRHPRVQVSPISIMVAVAVWPSEPPQHSPMFGHRASSQTVLRFSLRRSRLIWANLSPPGSSRFNHSGFLALSCRPGSAGSASGQDSATSVVLSQLPSYLPAWCRNGVGLVVAVVRPQKFIQRRACGIAAAVSSLPAANLCAGLRVPAIRRPDSVPGWPHLTFTQAVPEALQRGAGALQLRLRGERLGLACARALAATCQQAGDPTSPLAKRLHTAHAGNCGWR